MLPNKIQKWIEKDIFPPRALLSGSGDLYPVALEIASQIQGVDTAEIEQGIHADTLLLRDQGESLKIGENEHDEGTVRHIIKWCVQKPTAPHRVVILEHLERASYNAPQALLKLVEEPPPEVVLLFTTQNHHQILDTILSRMTVVSVPYLAKITTSLEEVDWFFTPGDLISKFQEIELLVKTATDAKDKTQIHRFCLQLIHYVRSHPEWHPHLGLFFQSFRAIKQNVNARLTLERLALLTTKQ